MSSLLDPGAVPAGSRWGEDRRRRSGVLISLLQLRWFVRLRWLLVALALAALAIERFLDPRVVRPVGLVLPILALALANGVWMAAGRLLHLRYRRTEAEDADLEQSALLLGNAQVSVDLLLLTLLLRFSGGVENPMSLFYLFHMGIGGLLLRTWQAVLQGAWGLLLFVALVGGEYAGWLHHYEFLPQFRCPGLFARTEFVVVSSAVLATGIAATLYFTLHITGRLFARERELVAAYRTLRRSEAAIFDLQQRRSRFLQTAAHQLKSPLATIETLVGLMRDRIVPPAAVDSTYDKIAQRCREGIAQVTELLTLARVQRSDPRRHQRCETDVAAVVAEVCARLLPLAERKQVSLRCCDPSPASLTAAVDGADLADCISNLLENAIKYTNGPGRVRVAVRRCSAPQHVLGRSGELSGEAEEEGGTRRDWVCVSVADSGIGIDAKALSEALEPGEQGSIFDAYRRGENALAAGIAGTGLGLTIVREVVEQAGGRILVISEKGEGTLISVAFPRRGRAALTIRETRETLLLDRDSERAAISVTARDGAALRDPLAGS